jgi:hypothetical protein
VALGGILTIPDCDLKASRVFALVDPIFLGAFASPKTREVHQNAIPKKFSPSFA